MSRRSLAGGLLLLAGTPPLRAMTPLRLAHPDDSDDPLWEGNGIFQALLAEVITNLAKLPLTCFPRPWLRAQRMVAAGEADAVLCPRSVVRNEFLHFSTTPLIELRSCWLVRRDDSRFAATGPERVPDLVKLDVLGAEVPTVPLLHGTRTITAPDQRSQVAMIAAGRADIAPVLELRGHCLLRSLGLGERLILLPMGRPVGFHFGIRRDYPDVRLLIRNADDAIMCATADGTIDRIHQVAFRNVAGKHGVSVDESSGHDHD